MSTFRFASLQTRPALQVDEKGTTLHDGIRDERPSAQALPPSARPSTCMPMNRRTQDLWKRTNPGIMHQYIKTPCSSSHDHYQWDEDQIDEKTRTNWMRHRSKTEFSKYVEADSRLKQLVRGKGHNA